MGPLRLTSDIKLLRSFIQVKTHTSYYTFHHIEIAWWTLLPYMLPYRRHLRMDEDLNPTSTVQSDIYMTYSVGLF